MQTLVAVYPTRSQAEQVRQRLLQRGIANERVALNPEGTPGDGVGRKDEHRSWWDWLFGSDVPDEHREWYRSNLRDGRTALSVYLDAGARRDEIEAILHEQGALDVGLPAVAQCDVPGKEGEERIPVVKEELQVGKRQTERKYHVRVYTTERPVQEAVTLRDERVIVERKPVAGGAKDASPPAAREFDVIEKHEEPVVAKKGRTTEEVVLHKDIRQRTETVKGKVQETHVDVDRPGESPRQQRPIHR